MKRFSRSRINRTNPYHIRYSQNFIKTQKLALDIVRQCNFSKENIVIEIGPGKGVITEPLLYSCKAVIGVEKDPKLFSNLKVKFKEQSNFEVHNQDFLKYNLPKNEKYKVIGNIPFSITSEILRKLLESPTPPEDITLIVQKEAAIRLLGSDYQNTPENLFSLRYKPWFECTIKRHLFKTDFYPVPSVDIVIINIRKREESLISKESKDAYLKFISYCFTSWKKNIKDSLKNFFTYKQLGIISKNSKINLNLKPSELNFEKWIELFEIYLKFGKKG